MDECFDLQLGKMSSKKSREGPHQTQYIKNNNVLWGRFVLEDLPMMSFSEAERSKFSLRPGDLLVCEGGEIGRAAIWEHVGREIFYQKALHRLRVKNGKTSPRFFFHYLRYCAASRILEKISTGTTILHLPRERLAALRLPFPKIELQRAIAVSLDSLVEAEAQARARVERLKTVRSTLLNKELVL